MQYLELHNLGTFATLEALWEAYPEGGHEGDYATVGTLRVYWDRYKVQWVTPDGGPTSDGRVTQSVSGDLSVGADLYVGGTLHYSGVRTMCKGLFPSVLALSAAAPEPEVGEWAYVYDSVNEVYNVYRCTEAGVWTEGEVIDFSGSVLVYDVISETL